ncbi:MAG: DNA polymerase III subunit [Erysipelotrichia bacterium]|nr:DNA polymerase III subunit [Erysipelotrichia bacterium]
MPENSCRFSRILLQELPVKHLVRSFARGRIAQTYLFTGNASTGRMLTALAFAALLQCQNPVFDDLENPDSCGRCDSCLRIAAGSHPDVNIISPDGYEIRINQVRAMQEVASLKPGVGRWQVFIIDPADRLNVSSANSLLKILEEAPSHAVFILIARDTGAVLPTVLSRSEIVRFASPSHQAARETIMRFSGFTAEQAASCYALTEGRFGQALQIAKEFHELMIPEGIRNSHSEYLIQLETMSQLRHEEFASLKTLDEALKMAGKMDQQSFLPLRVARKAFCRSLFMTAGLPAAFALMFSSLFIEHLEKASSLMKKSFEPLLSDAKRSYPAAMIKEIDSQLSSALDNWSAGQIEELLLCLLNWYADAMLSASKADETLLLNLDRKEDIMTVAQVDGMDLLRARIEMLEHSVGLLRRYVQPALILENVITQIGGPEA